MAKLFVEIGARVGEFQKALNRIERQVNQFSRKMERLGTNLTQSISLPLAGLGAASVGTFAQFDKLAKGLDAIGTSGKTGEQQLKDLLDVVKDVRTTIDLKDAATGSLQLQAVGLSADRAKESLRQLAIAATLSGGSSDDVAEVARQLSQAAAKGKILQQELRIILERIPALAGVIKDEFGTVTADGLREAGVSADEFISRLTKAIASNEKFANVQSSLAKELETFKINLQLSAAELGKNIAVATDLQGVLRRVSGVISDITKSFSLLSPEQRKSIVNFGIIAIAAGPVALGLSKVVSMVGAAVGAFKALRAALFATSLTLTPVIALLAGVAAVAAGIFLLKKQFDNLTSAVRSANNVMASAEAQANLEISSTKGLINILTDETAARESKERALKSLQEKYPDYFGNLSVEKSSVSDITAAYDAFKISILEVSKARAAEAKLTELAAREQALLAEQKQIEADAELKGLRSFLKRQTAGAGKDAIVLRREQVNKSLAELAKEQQLIIDIFNDATAKLGGQEVPGGDDSGGGGELPGEKIAQNFVLPVNDAIRKLIRENPLPRLFTDTEAAAQGFFEASSKLADINIKPSVLAEINKALNDIDVRARIIGEDSFSALGEKVNFLKDRMAELAVIWGENSIQVLALRETLAPLEEEFNKIARQKEVFDAITGIVSDLTAGFDGFFETLFSGGKNAFKAISDSLKKLVVELAKAVAVSAVLALIFSALGGGSFLSLFKTAGIGQGGFLGNILQLIPGNAEGGIVPPGYPNDSYLTRLTSGEAIIPLSKLNQFAGGPVNVTGEFRIAGNDLVAVVDRNVQNRERTRGR